MRCNCEECDSEANVSISEKMLTPWRNSDIFSKPMRRSILSINNRVARLVAAQVILLWILLSVTHAEDYVAISRILKNPSDLQLHAVTLRGTIHDLQELPPHPGRLGPVIGACRFRLKDETGSIAVEIHQRCTEAIDTTRQHSYEVMGIIQTHDAYPSLIATAIRPLNE